MNAPIDHITEALKRAEKLRAENEKIRAKTRLELARARQLLAEVAKLIQRSKTP